MVKKSLQILHFGHAPLPPAIADANPACTNRHPGRWVLNLCMAQQRSPNPLAPRLATLVRRLPQSIGTTMDGIPVDFLASRAKAPLLRGHQAERRILKKLAASQAPDLIHAHGLENAYALAAQDTKRPYVITAQGLMFMIIPMLKPPLRSWLRIIRIYEHIVLNKAKHVIAKSDTVARALNEHYPHLTLYRIPNTFDPRLLEINANHEPNRLVFVGTITPNKGLHILREALQIVIQTVPDVKLHIVGDFRGKGSSYEQNEIDILRKILGNRLQTFGKVPNINVAQIVGNCHVLIAPTQWEMFGNQLIEALLVGTHGIVTENTGLAENAHRFGNATVVPQQDPQALAKAIIETLRRKEFPERKQARQRIIETMGPETVANAHYELYQSILHEHRKQE